MTRKLLSPVFLLLLLFIGFSGCREKEKIPQATSFKIQFLHHVDGNTLVPDSMIYTNAAGNNYEVTDVMYFISDLCLYQSNGTVIRPASWDDIHYVDIHNPGSLEWLVSNDAPSGNYDSITFIFGISEAKNQSFMFVNPPEVNMAWPEVLGGGYHYLMLNGWWKDTQAVRRSFNFHLGIGQIYANNSGQAADITGFIHNAFTVNPDSGSFTITQGKTITAYLTMNIESWFETPIIYDHNFWGGAIMQNQEAMHAGCLNGKDVFSLRWE